MTVPLPPVDKPVPVIGSPADDPSRPPVRREIRDMRKNYPKEWDLLLLGLERFKNTDENHPLSYYQIAGIHGRPYTTWPDEGWNKDRIKQVNPDDDNQSKGFCTHTSILFLPWHRPYLALFETELRRHVQAVAEQFTPEEGGADYLKAAKTFRLPYWDWALPEGAYKDVFPDGAFNILPEDVVYPKSRSEPKFETNPLALYNFGELGKKDKEINWFGNVNATLRQPPSFDERHRDPNATKSNEQKMETVMEDFIKNPRFAKNVVKGKNLTERVVYLLQSYNVYNPVSSNYFFHSQKFANYGSLEDVHNSVHGYVGGTGHMGNPEVAAFDPIFWLHHANIDRLFAIWQALKDKGEENQYVRSEPARFGGGTWSQSWRADDTIDTPLTPFTKSEDGTMWNSVDVKSTTTFGYVYPETQSWEYPTEEAIYGQLGKIYPNASLATTMTSTKSKRVAATKALTARAETLIALEAAPVKTAELAIAPSAQLTESHQAFITAVEQAHVPAERKLEDMIKDDKYLEWLVDIRAEKHSQGGNFMVHVFLGSPDDSTSTLYLADPNHVAAFSTFGSSENTGCGACKEGQAAGLQVTGQIPLTIALVERYLAGMLNSITPDDVIPFLQKNLHWRVTDLSGERSSRADIQGLLVGVVSNEVTLPEGDSTIPQYAPTVTAWPAATTRENGEGRGKGTGYTETS